MDEVVGVVWGVMDLGGQRTYPVEAGNIIWRSFPFLILHFDGGRGRYLINNPLFSRDVQFVQRQWASARSGTINNHTKLMNFQYATRE